MNRWKVILAVIVIFVAGAATGAITTRTYAPKVIKRTQVVPSGMPSPERRQEYIEKLDRELDLTDEQRLQVEAILASSQERMKRIWEPFGKQAREEYRQTRKEISELLTPEQREKMKNLRRDRDNRPERREGPEESRDQQRHGSLFELKGKRRC